MLDLNPTRIERKMKQYDERFLISGGAIDQSMVKDDDEEDISDEEVQARLQALMDENNAEKASMEQVIQFQDYVSVRTQGFIFHAIYICIVLFRHDELIKSAESRWTCLLLTCVLGFRKGYGRMLYMNAMCTYTYTHTYTFALGKKICTLTMR
jgi:hypothetical protein